MNVQRTQGGEQPIGVAEMCRILQEVSELSPGKRVCIRRWQRIEEAARQLFADCLAEPEMPYTRGMEKLRQALESDA